MSRITLKPASLETRRNWYVRPAGTTYGSADGSSYANAWAGLSNIAWAALNGQFNTLWICGVHYEQFTPPTGLVGKNADQRLEIRCDYFPDIGIIDGTVSFDGSHTVNPTNVYDGTPSSWAVVSGAIYAKTTTRCPYGFYEDGKKLTPLVLNTAAERSDQYVIANLAVGQFAWLSSGTVNSDGSGGAISNKLYYRATDGAAPATHSIYCCGRNYDNLVPVNFDTCSHLDVYLYVRRFWKNSSSNDDAYALQFRSCTNVKIDGIVDDNLIAMRLYRCTTVEVKQSFVCRDNGYSGLIVENGTGSSSDYKIRGTWKRNGRAGQLYAGPTNNYGGDKDGIGIGGTGGTYSSIVVEDCDILDSGPNISTVTTIDTTSGSPTATVASATGVYPGMIIAVASGVTAGTTVSSISGTTVTMSANATGNNTGASVTFQFELGMGILVSTSITNAAETTCRRNLVSGCNGGGIVMDTTDWSGGGLYSNIIINCARPSGAYRNRTGMTADMRGVIISSYVRNNIFVRCMNKAALGVWGHASTDYPVNNNSFWDCGDSTWTADLWVIANHAHVLDKNNHWYKTSFTSSKCISRNSSTYILTDIPATYQAANTNSSGNITGNPSLPNGTSGVTREDYIPPNTSILRLAGLTIADSDYLDAMRKPKSPSAADIGALWAQ